MLKKNVRKLFDLAIFLDVKLEVRKKRRINRDIIERSRTKNEVENRFEKMIIPMHKKFVETLQLLGPHHHAPAPHRTLVIWDIIIMTSVRWGPVAESIW